MAKTARLARVKKTRSGKAPIISVQHLSKRFGDFVAVDDISFDVQQGKIFAFLGPNGAGKTTTIKMLTTLLDPTAGKLLINACDPRKDKAGVRRSFGIVFQDPSTDDELTAQENMELHGVLYGMKKAERRTRIKELLEVVELTDRKDSLMKTFSGGMKRRLEIARSFLHTPAIIFLDEPTAGLDPQTRNKMWEYVKHLNKEEGVTVFFTTHYMEEAERVADEVAIIDHGKIIAHGSPEELKKQTGKDSLEEAFLSLTGRSIREDEVGAIDHLRQQRQMWRGKK